MYHNHGEKHHRDDKLLHDADESYSRSKRRAFPRSAPVGEKGIDRPRWKIILLISYNIDSGKYFTCARGKGTHEQQYQAHIA